MHALGCKTYVLGRYRCHPIGGQQYLRIMHVTEGVIFCAAGATEAPDVDAVPVCSGLAQGCLSPCASVIWWTQSNPYITPSDLQTLARSL